MDSMSTIATAAVGMAVGAAVLYAATNAANNPRQSRKTVHNLARGAEKTIVDLDKAICHYMK